MKAPLSLLHLEDDPGDAALVQATLTAAGIDCSSNCVQTRDEFVAALEQGGVDLVLSDFSLPAFDGLSAVAMVRARWPKIPIILVSGTLGEERAIDALKGGATDYVLKERLGRLAPAVLRAMREVEERTERRRLEAQFIEAQKMEVIGQLAAGVAHDFNNILAVIMGYTEMLTARFTDDNPQRKYAEEILDASRRACGLTRQLLVFSRKQTVQPTVLDLNAVVRDLEKMLRRLLDENIAMTVISGASTWLVKADSGYVGQVLMNLVVNARDAMPTGGKLTIATRNVALDALYARSHPGVIPGDYVMISVRDTGTGMSEAVRSRLFEAFFTTKAKGKGTGLGLATCQTIVQQCGGYIGVESELGIGTTFEVFLPRVDQPLDRPSDAARSSPAPRGSETLMVVEDEPVLRRLACRALQAQGYVVLSAANGQEALHTAREHQGAPIQLVITDVIMPLMGGKELAAWLQAAYPLLKFLFTSGYTDDAIAQHGILEPGIAFLPKPYTPAHLAHKVRECLDTGESPTATAAPTSLTSPTSL
jgi:signal transduction histidine kinase